MSREELGALLRLLVDSGRITASDAANIIRRFDSGILDFDRLPVLPSLLPRTMTPQEHAIAIRDVVAQVPEKTATVLLTQATQPVTTSTPPAVKQFLRRRLRDHFRADMERTLAKYAQGVASGGDIGEWQQAMERELYAYYARQYVAGAGRPLTVQERARVGQMFNDQMPYLFRFSGEMLVKSELGSPMSFEAINARAQLYQGPGWEAWHRGDESAQTLGQDGYVIHYQARDDGRVCSRCMDAQNNGPYAAGEEHPRPGEICLGRGRCRCTLRIEFDMDAWNELTGRREAA